MKKWRISQKIGILKNLKSGFLDVKNVVSKIKNSSVGFNSGLCIKEGTEVMNSKTGKQKIARLKHREKKNRKEG